MHAFIVAELAIFALVRSGAALQSAGDRSGSVERQLSVLLERGRVLRARMEQGTGAYAKGEWLKPAARGGSRDGHPYRNNI